LSALRPGNRVGVAASLQDHEMSASGRRFFEIWGRLREPSRFVES
jgi:hypothetical protein